jgi:hypothetical protein
MKNRYLLFFFLVLSGLTATAQRAPKIVFPTTPFNKEEVKHMLETGTCSIKGNVSKKGNYLVNLVILFPVTPYFTEYLELKRKDKKGKKDIQMSDEAYSYRILTQLNMQNGTFEINGLKPGKYYIETTVHQTKSASGEKQVGTETTTGYNAFGQAISSQSRAIMRKENYIYKTTDVLNTIVEITADGQVLNVTL